jgi:GcrA cell cycle regulator
MSSGISERNRNWLPEEDEMIKRLAGDGLSAAQIAAGLTGRSRNSVIGRLNRLGLVLSSLQGRVPNALRPKRKPKQPQQYRPRVVFPKPTVVEGVPLPMSQFIFAEEVTASPVTLMELTEDTCRWPAGDMYCGGMALAGKPYCAKHDRLAHQPTSPRRGSPRWKHW